MERIELYLNSKNRPVIDVYKDEKVEVSSKQIKNYDALDTIDKISTYKIQSVSIKREDLVVKYNSFVVNIREYQDVFKLNEMKELKNIITKYYNHQNQKKVKKKKVQRKNKHTGSKIIAATLVLSLIGTGAVAANEKIENNNIPNYSLNIIVEETTDKEKIIVKDSEIDEVKIVETMPTTTEPETDVVSLNYKDNSNSAKAQTTLAYYGKTIKKYAEMYGLDSELMIAIATQERGIHAQKMDAGGATGLMQIQNSVWRNQKLTAYNYETQKYETITVEEDKLSDVFYNIKVGCMIFQNTLNYMDYNVVAAVQCYNMGVGNMSKILNAYAKQTGKTVKEILNNKTDTGWLNYRSLINQGDRNYVEHVFSWMQQENQISILNQDEEINIAVTSMHK